MSVHCSLTDMDKNLALDYIWNEIKILQAYFFLEKWNSKAFFKLKENLNCASPLALCNNVFLQRFSKKLILAKLSKFTHWLT